MGAERAVHLRIHGRVQGVFYRASARDRARELDLRGWVRNCRDGTVEAHAEGSEESVETFIEWCRRGSTAARVERVEVRPASADDAADDFEIHS